MSEPDLQFMFIYCSLSETAQREHLLLYLIMQNQPDELLSSQLLKKRQSIQGHPIKPNKRELIRQVQHERMRGNTQMENKARGTRYLKGLVCQF